MFINGEKSYLIFVLVALLCDLVLCRPPRKSSHLLKNVNANVCTHEHCVRVSDEILRSLNESVDPCDDFFEYSCGEWIKRQKIPKGRNQFSAITQLSINNEKLLMEALETDDPHDSPPLKKVKNFYRSCLDTHTIDRRGATPAVDFIRKLNSWELFGDGKNAWRAKDWNFYETLQRVHVASPAEIFFVVDVIPNPVKKDKSKKEVIMVSKCNITVRKI